MSNNLWILDHFFFFTDHHRTDHRTQEEDAAQFERQYIFFKQYLAPELWKRIEATFSGSDTDDNWRALQAYTEIGRELGLAIAAQLGYDYPHQLDERICAYLDDVKALPRDEGTFQPVVLRP